MRGQLTVQGFLPVLLGIAWLWGNVPVLQVVQGKNVKEAGGHQHNQWRWSFVLFVGAGGKLQLQPMSSLHSGKNTTTIHVSLAGRRAGKAGAAWVPSQTTTASG